MIVCPLLYPVTVIIGFQQSHYKVNEGDGCVRVCAEVVAGRLKGNSSVSFNFRTSPNTAPYAVTCSSLDVGVSEVVASAGG